jgi:glycosyltransferase involved in cell wall biosynthesis
MKLIYITNTRLPSEKANSYQSMQMCYSFSKVFDEVELWTGRARNIEEFNNIKNVFDYYNIKATFSIKRFFQFDSVVLGHLNEFIWANLRGVVYSINACLHLIKYKNYPEVIVYTRVWHVLFVYMLFKKIGLVNNQIFYESHKFSKPIVKILSKIDGLIVINRYLNTLYKEHDIKQVFTAHDGVNIEEYADISKYKFTPNKKEYIILYTGSLFSWKGVNTLVDCIKYLPKNFNLVCVGGSGKYLSDFKSYVDKTSESNRIKVIAHVSKKALLEYTESADVLVLPNSAKDKMSLYTSPIKLFEYMASNRPIVASNLSSITEILSNKNSFLFEPDNAKDLAENIQKAISLDCSKFVSQACKDVESCTWEKRAYNIKGFIQSIRKNKSICVE